MWISQPITTRIFVWLAAIAIPFQGLSFEACGCAGDVSDNRSHGQNESQSCCASDLPVSDSASSSCCSQAETSSCACTGASVCRCAESNLPESPAIPPAGNHSPEQIVADSAGATSLDTFCLASTARQHLSLHQGANSLTALDCCVTLCRFTL